MTNPIRLLDLHDYGVDGVAEIAFPTFRKRREHNNAIAKYYKGGIDKRGALDPQKLMEVMCVGDIEILQTLLFVRSAPFPQDLEGFTRFCDEMDERALGSASAMYDRIKEVIEELKEVPSPLEPSPSAEIQP